jgi:hypothetical protein
MTDKDYPACETEAEALYEAARFDLGEAITSLTKILTQIGMSGREKKNITWISNRLEELISIRGKMK